MACVASREIPAFSAPRKSLWIRASVTELLWRGVWHADCGLGGSRDTVPIRSVGRYVGGSAVDRDQLAAIFYGEGRVPPPWPTDCPVRFDTWLAFAQPSAEALGRRVDVILAVNEEHGVRRVLDHFSTLMVLGPSNPIAAGSFVVARLTLDELVRAVLPLTNLFGVVRLAQNVPEAELKDAAVGPDTPGIISAPATEDPIERVDERKRHLTWLVKLLVAVAESAAGTTRVPAIEAVLPMLRKAMAEASLTQVAAPPGKPVVDRRRGHP